MLTIIGNWFGIRILLIKKINPQLTPPKEIVKELILNFIIFKLNELNDEKTITVLMALLPYVNYGRIQKNRLNRYFYFR
jgi:hypothetical protein